MLTLALDASTYVGTVAVFDDARVLAERDVAMRGEREERLMPAVDEALRAAGIAPRDLARIVCGAGPGSFTSLRIAGSIAKGMALGLAIPLYAVSSLWLIVAGAEPRLAPGTYRAALDAMRGDEHAQTIVVEANGTIDERDEPRVIAAASNHGSDHRPIGPAYPGAHAPHARGAARLEFSRLAPVDLATWEPTYGRLAEAQVKWEAAHGRPLATG